MSTEYIATCAYSAFSKWAGRLREAMLSDDSVSREQRSAVSMVCEAVEEFNAAFSSMITR